MTNKLVVEKRHSFISFASLFIGIICFFIVFIQPTRIANIGSLIGDYITFFLTGAGIVLSIIAIARKTEKNFIPVLSLILSSSFFIYWVLIIFMLFTGQTEFGP